jgi:saccharopine dehydrogenase (NAD+, L-lysine-forming)
MRPIPEYYPDLKETGFFVGGFNWFTDWFITPLTMVLPRISKNGLQWSGRLMNWSLKKFSKPPFGTLLKLEAQGEKDNRQAHLEISIFHADGYMLTAIPSVACLLQYLDGSIRKPGLFFQALSVEPERFMEDLALLGAEIEIKLSKEDLP